MSPEVAIELAVPHFESRYLKMYWTVQRIWPTPVRWSFLGEWDAIRAEKYLTDQFKYRDEITFTRTGHQILMTYKGDDRNRPQPLEDATSQTSN